MKLSELLTETGDYNAPYGKPESGEIYVMQKPGADHLDRRYWRLEDYKVCATVSGPGIVLWQGSKQENERSRS